MTKLRRLFERRPAKFLLAGVICCLVVAAAVRHDHFLLMVETDGCIANRKAARD